LQSRKILLMTHTVLGYPDFETSYEVIAAMVEAGVDLMELQIPFSEPIADGPVILRANQEALAQGATVNRCVEFAGRIAADFDIPFLFMSYYNILFKYGLDRFTQMMQTHGLCGAIVPDLPPEEADDYMQAMQTHQLDPIYIFAPTSSVERLRYIATQASGFVYCVARKGVTGSQTAFSRELDDYLALCRQATTLPLALGFGVQTREDVAFLEDKIDIAVVGSQTIRLVDDEGVGAVKPFIQSLRV
jgi:tryptophan synthase alpha chain